MKNATLVSRVAAAVFGGYAATASGVMLLAALLPRVTPLASADAVVLTAMCGFPAYLLTLLWSFSHSDLRRVWLVLGGITTVSALTVTALAVSGRAV